MGSSRRCTRQYGEPRVLPLVGDLAALVERRWRAREYHTPDGGTALAAFVFHRDGHRARTGGRHAVIGCRCAPAYLVERLFWVKAAPYLPPAERDTVSAVFRSAAATRPLPRVDLSLVLAGFDIVGKQDEVGPYT